MSDKRGPIERAMAEANTIMKNQAKIEDESSIRKIGEDFIRKIGEVDINIRSGGTGPEQDPSCVTDALRYHGAILKDLPKEPADKTVYTAYLKKTALITMSLEARLPDETTRLLSGNFEEADEAVSLFFGYMVACGFHPGSVTRAMREFLDSCDE